MTRGPRGRRPRAGLQRPSCVACHTSAGRAAPAGSTGISRSRPSTDDPARGGLLLRFSMDFGPGRFDYRMGVPPALGTRRLRADPRLLAAIHPGFRESRSVVLHRYGTDPAYNAWRESVPGQHGMVSVRISERNPPPLFGMGLIDAIPDEAIEAAAKRKFPGSAGVKGRVSRLKDGRIGRFGWKAQTATLKEFVLSAAAGEMGLEVPGRHQAADPRLPGLAATGLDMDEEECEALIDHVRSLPAPVAIQPADEEESAQVKSGEATFKSIGCTGCHLPRAGRRRGDLQRPAPARHGPPARRRRRLLGVRRRPPEGRAARGRGSRRHRHLRPGVADAAALGPSRLGALPARRPRREDRPGHRIARRPGCVGVEAIRGALPPAEATSRGVPHVARRPAPDGMIEPRRQADTAGPSPSKPFSYH